MMIFMNYLKIRSVQNVIIMTHTNYIVVFICIYRNFATLFQYICVCVCNREREGGAGGGERERVCEQIRAHMRGHHS